jgi:hypothetical protein
VEFVGDLHEQWLTILSCNDLDESHSEIAHLTLEYCTKDIQFFIVLDDRTLKHEAEVATCFRRLREQVHVGMHLVQLTLRYRQGEK